MEYEQFLATKRFEMQPTGFDYPVESMNAMLFNWQKDIVRWALKKGKAALFEDCGLGKTPQQLEWARIIHETTGGDVLIFAPLAVSQQTKREGEKFGIRVNIATCNDDLMPGINITNYEKMEKFDPTLFVGVVLDESSILKHHGSKTRQYLTDAFRHTKYKLACTATPSPNDFVELGNHSEFLGVMTQTEMLSTFFVHDGGETSKWRLKGHAEDKFWEWVASWACVLQNPADLGYGADGFNLPDLTVIEHVVKNDVIEGGDGQIAFIADVINMDLNQRRTARRNSTDGRTDMAAEIASVDNQVLVWCDLNAESEALGKKIADAIEIKGADSNEFKEEQMNRFTVSDLRCLVSKPSISGWGMNWQGCHEMIFVGLSDSFEAYYQAVRRCWRFGQEHPVTVHIVVSEQEGAVKQNIERKQEDAMRLMRELVKHTQKILSEEVHQTKRISESYYAFTPIQLPIWLKEEA